MILDYYVFLHVAQYKSFFQSSRRMGNNQPTLPGV